MKVVWVSYSHEVKPLTLVSHQISRQSVQHDANAEHSHRQCPTENTLSQNSEQKFTRLPILVFFWFLTARPSLLQWCCWLGGKKGIRPVKTEWWGTGVVICLLCSEVQMICIWSSWCHCHPTISCSSKIQNGLPSWYRLTQVVLEKRPLNGCSSISFWQVSIT